MPREPEDMPDDVILISLVGAEEFHFRLVNFPTGKKKLLDPHVTQLPVIYPTIRIPSNTVILTGHASARNNSGLRSLNQNLSDERCVAVRDEILRNVPDAVIRYHGEGDVAAQRELKAKAVTPNSGFHRAVSVRVVKGPVPIPDPKKTKEVPFQIGIKDRIRIEGLGVPALPGGTGKQAAEQALRKIPPQFRGLVKEIVKKLGKEMKDEFDLPSGLGAAIVKISGSLVIKDERKKRETNSRFETFAAVMSEGEIVVDTTLTNGGFATFNADETNDASTFTAKGALLDFGIGRNRPRSLQQVRIFNSNPQQGIIRMSPPMLEIPFNVASGVVPLFCGVSNVSLKPF